MVTQQQVQNKGSHGECLPVWMWSLY